MDGLRSARGLGPASFGAEIIWFTVGSWTLIAVCGAMGIRGPQGMVCTLCFYVPALLLLAYQHLAARSPEVEAVALTSSG